MIHNTMNGLTSLSRLSDAKTRSICPENRTGAKGCGGMATEGTGKNCARDLGIGWKISPSIDIAPGDTLVMADVDGPAIIKHIWITDSCQANRTLILRIFWENSPIPSVEVPLGDFFASADTVDYRQLTSLPVCVNPKRAMNCYWEMPFRKHCKITLENIYTENITVYYQIDYLETPVEDDAAYFHAQFRRVNPLPYKEVYTILDHVHGKGQYVGTYMFWGVNNSGWWGEGEIKFYLDGDKEFPTICGTGTEDYFCGSYNFDVNGKYIEYTTPYAGLSKVLTPDGTYASQQRFSMYRWHICDPIYFDEDIRVTIQALGWRLGGRYLPLQDDISSVAFWYQDQINATHTPLPDRDTLEII